MTSRARQSIPWCGKDGGGFVHGCRRTQARMWIRERRNVTWVLAGSRVNLYSPGYPLEEPGSHRSTLCAGFILELLLFLPGGLEEITWCQHFRQGIATVGQNSRPTSTFRGILAEITSSLCEDASEILKLGNERTTW